jgi:hypothetical protein
MPILTVNTIMGVFDLKRYNSLLNVYNAATGEFSKGGEKWITFENRPYMESFLSHIIEYLTSYFQPIIDSENENEP